MMMIKYAKTMAMLGFLLAATLGLSLFAQQQKKEWKSKNLKLLPKDIGHDELDKLMDFYCTSLGVKCGYCHTPSATRPGKFDFALDSAAAHKQDAREMIAMTFEMNDKYFFNQDADHKNIQLINCYTCHRGHEYPIVPIDSLTKKHGKN